MALDETHLHEFIIFGSSPGIHICESRREASLAHNAVVGSLVGLITTARRVFQAASVKNRDNPAAIVDQLALLQ